MAANKNPKLKGIETRKKINAYCLGLWNDKERRIKAIVIFAFAFICISGILGQVFGQGFGKRYDEWGYVINRTITLNPFVLFFGTLFSSTGWSGMVMTTIFLFIVVFIYRSTDDSSQYHKEGYQYADNGLYGSARENEEKDIKEFMFVGSIDDTTETIFGKINGKVVSFPREEFNEVKLHNQFSKHTAIIGVSGSGKTFGFINTETLQIIRRGESLVQSDPKGASYEETAQAFVDAGYVVKVFNLKPREMKTSDSWDALNEIAAAGEDMYETIAQTFAGIIIDNTTGADGGDHFWDTAETNLLKAAALYQVTKPTGDRSIGGMYRMLIEKTETELRELFEILPMEHPAKQAWLIYLKAKENVAGNVIIGLTGRLNVFQSRLVKDITSTSDIDLELPAKQKCAYYVIMSDQENTYSFLSSLFFSFLFIRIISFSDSLPEKKCPVPVNILLDEFPNVGRIPEFSEKISTVRSRRVKITFVIQNIAQLKHMYPTLWESLLSACDTQVFLGSNDETTEKYISNKTGITTTKTETPSRTVSKFNPFFYEPTEKETEGSAKRQLMTTDEVSRMDRNNLLLFTRGYNVSTLDRFGWIEHPNASEIADKKLALSERVPLYRMSKEFVELYGVRKDVEHLVDMEALLTLAELQEQERMGLDPSQSKPAHTRTDKASSHKEILEEFEDLNSNGRRRRRTRGAQRSVQAVESEIVEPSVEVEETPLEEPEIAPTEDLHKEDSPIDEMFSDDSLDDMMGSLEDDSDDEEPTDGTLYGLMDDGDDDGLNIDDFFK